MIATAANVVGIIAAAALGWIARRIIHEAYGYQERDLDLAYAQGVADERAASRKRGQELAEVIDLKQQAPLYMGHWLS